MHEVDKIQRRKKESPKKLIMDATYSGLKLSVEMKKLMFYRKLQGGKPF